MSRPQERVRHTIRRADWTCSICDVDYPCAERRGRYLAKLQKRDNPDLRRILRQMAGDAQAAMGLSDEEAHRRFIAWQVTDGAERQL